MIPLRTTWDNRGNFGIHLYFKKSKMGQEWAWDTANFPLRCCMITSRSTWDKSVKKGLRYSHFPSKTLYDYIENHLGQEGVLWYSFVFNKIQNLSRNSSVKAIFPLRRCRITLRTNWDKRGYLSVHLYQKDPKWANGIDIGKSLLLWQKSVALAKVYFIGKRLLYFGHMHWF